MGTQGNAELAAEAGHVGDEFMDRVLWEAHDRRIDAHDRRITRLEEGYGAVSMAVTQIESKLERNNELTTQIHNDTKDIREMIAGAKVFGKVAAWMGGITATIVSVYAVAQLLGK